jgi:hypothetical protein
MAVQTLQLKCPICLSLSLYNSPNFRITLIKNSKAKMTRIVPEKHRIKNIFQVIFSEKYLQFDLNTLIMIAEGTIKDCLQFSNDLLLHVSLSFLLLSAAHFDF